MHWIGRQPQKMEAVTTYLSVSNMLHIEEEEALQLHPKYSARCPGRVDPRHSQEPNSNYCFHAPPTPSFVLVWHRYPGIAKRCIELQEPEKAPLHLGVGLNLGARR